MATYTIALRFVSGSRLPIGDFFQGTSDPYVVAYLDRKGTNELVFRTSTARSTRDPKWQEDDVWHVRGVQEGAVIKIWLYDEDPRKLDNDRLGVAELRLDNLEQLASQDEAKEMTLKVSKRKANMKVYALTYIYTWAAFQDLNKQAASITVELKVKKDEHKPDKPRQAGPMRYSIHFSPILGRMAGTKGSGSNVSCFLAYRLQLKDIPDDIRFEYTRKRKEIKMIYGNGVRGFLLRRALRAQHSTIYGFDRRTIVGACPRDEAAARFLEMTDAATDLDKKIFTYAIRPNGVLHFSQTGPAFAINHLSKHAMHCNAGKEVVYSGEFFFVRREKGEIGADAVRAGGASGEIDDDARKHAEKEDGRKTAASETIIKDDSLVARVRAGSENLVDSGGNHADNPRQRPTREKLKAKFSRSKREYSDKLHQQHYSREKQRQAANGGDAGNRAANGGEKGREGGGLPDGMHTHSIEEFTLVFDNSSGTFFPDEQRLKDVQKLFEHNFPGLRVIGMAQSDDKLSQLKKTRQANALPEDGEDGAGVYRQASSASSSSISSSEFEGSIGSTGAAERVARGVDKVKHPRGSRTGSPSH